MRHLLLLSLLVGCYDVDALRPPEGCPPGASICDGFEGEAFDEMWTRREHMGSVSLDPSTAHSGERSLHVHLDTLLAANSGAIAAIETSEAFPASQLHMRFFLHPDVGDTDDYDLLRVASTADPEGGITVWRDDGHGDGQILTREYVDGKQDGGLRSTPNASSSVWYCIEWELANLDGATGSTGAMRAYVDGVLSAEDIAAPTSPTPHFDHLRVGTELIQRIITIDTNYWIDDFVVAEQPIGCDVGP